MHKVKVFTHFAISISIFVICLVLLSLYSTSKDTVNVEHGYIKSMQYGYTQVNYYDVNQQRGYVVLNTTLGSFSFFMDHFDELLTAFRERSMELESPETPSQVEFILISRFSYDMDDERLMHSSYGFGLRDLRLRNMNDRYNKRLHWYGVENVKHDQPPFNFSKSSTIELNLPFVHDQKKSHYKNDGGTGP